MQNQEITLNLIPLSLNLLYRNFRGRSILSAKGREFKNLVSFLLKSQKIVKPEFSKKNGLRIEIEFGSKKFFTKSGEIRLRYLDIDNLLKAAIDCFFLELGIDDSLIMDIKAKKFYSENDTTIIRIFSN